MGWLATCSHANQPSIDCFRVCDSVAQYTFEINKGSQKYRLNRSQVTCLFEQDSKSLNFRLAYMF